jgi:hypothetical protein
VSVVIDTNVLVVANGKHGAALPACVAACIDALDLARQGQVAVDDAQLILSEYRKHCSFAGQPGVGDAFFKWLWNRQADARHCVPVRITPHATRGFAEFPADPMLHRC